MKYTTKKQEKMEDEVREQSIVSAVLIERTNVEKEHVVRRSPEMAQQNVKGWSRDGLQTHRRSVSTRALHLTSDHC